MLATRIGPLADSLPPSRWAVHGLVAEAGFDAIEARAALVDDLAASVADYVSADGLIYRTMSNLVIARA